MGRLLLLFILLPAVELSLLIERGGHIGTLATLGVIAVTGFVGGTLARSQGLRVWSHVQREIAAGGLPADSLIDGLMILIAGALLITPGVLTDAFGFLCLVPAFRTLLKREVVRRFRQAVEENRVQVGVQGVWFHDTAASARPDREPQAGRPIVDATTTPRETESD